MAIEIQDTWASATTAGVTLDGRQAPTGGVWETTSSLGSTDVVSNGVNGSGDVEIRGASSTASAFLINSQPMGSGDVRLSALVRTAGGTNPHHGVMWRANADLSEFWQAYFTSATNLQIQKTGGALNNYSVSTINSATPALLEVEDVGGVITVKLRGTTVATFTDSAYATNRYVAVRARSAGRVGAFSAENLAAGAATAYTLSGPATATIGVASSAYTAGANGPITGTLTVTPSDSGAGGTFTPPSFSLSSGAPTATFTYTPAAAGVYQITIDDGAGGLAASPAVQTRVALNVGELALTDGIWTWFTDPRAVYKSGATYFGTVSGGGSIRVSKSVHSTDVTTTFNLHSLLEDDDHNNPGLLFLPDGRLVCFYSEHNDSAGTRYRVCSNLADFGNAASWSTEQLIADGTTLHSYSNPFLVGDRVFLFFRLGGGGLAGRIVMRSCAVTELASGASWAATTEVFATPSGSSKTEYTKFVQHPTIAGRVDVLITATHPNESGPWHVYHFYAMLASDGSATFHQSSGTQITATLPFDGSHCTQLYDGSTVKGWITDIAIGADGLPRALGTRYPANNGTDIRYLYWRNTGGNTWTQTEFPGGSIGDGLYAGEQYYSGLIAFDANDSLRTYVSREVAGVYELSEWLIDETSTPTFIKLRDITAGSSAHMARPYSPRNHNGEVALLWWTGQYTTFENYLTDVYRASGTAPDVSATADLTSLAIVPASVVANGAAAGVGSFGTISIAAMSASASGATAGSAVASLGTISTSSFATIASGAATTIAGQGSIAITSPSATASAGATGAATASMTTVSISPISVVAIGAVTVVANSSTVTVSPITGSASGGATAVASLGLIALASPSASASAGAGTSTAADLGAISVVAPTGSASGAASVAASLGTISTTAMSATASGAAAGAAVASLGTISTSPMSVLVSAGAAGNAVASLGTVSISPIAAVAAGSGLAIAGLRTLSIIPASMSVVIGSPVPGNTPPGRSLRAPRLRDLRA